jgi:hypothetical protein
VQASAWQFHASGSLHAKPFVILYRVLEIVPGDNTFHVDVLQGQAKTGFSPKSIVLIDDCQLDLSVWRKPFSGMKN